LGALQKRLARFEERSATDLEELGILVEVVGELGGERALGADIRDEALEPAIERLPRVAAIELGGRAAHLLDLIYVESLEQRLPVGEVPV
jgi:hypothetical protein